MLTQRSRFIFTVNITHQTQLGGLKESTFGFKVGLMDLLGFDDAHMKGSFLGHVLIAVGLDSNNGIYPLAYVIVETENKSSWIWFLLCLGEDLDLGSNSDFTFIRDRQKVLTQAHTSKLEGEMEIERVQGSFMEICNCNQYIRI
uniref:MULE transposase domain-containing protein n=1 Tax=Lactuca sativa TaxID=4236 RepID=A0A9R1UVZ0_LACSA|nr:hypothetical protein LSAT_V11C800406820 [Lactuca sativa]